MQHALTLFVKTGCPWCKRVTDFADAHGITFTTIKEKHEPGVLDELLRRGGVSQFPYLVDETAGVEMYESADIIEYLKTVYTLDPQAQAPDAPNACAIDIDML